jgi:hypothetical protein
MALIELTSHGAARFLCWLRGGHGPLTRGGGGGTSYAPLLSIEGTKPPNRFPKAQARSGGEASHRTDETREAQAQAKAKLPSRSVIPSVSSSHAVPQNSRTDGAALLASDLSQSFALLSTEVLVHKTKGKGGHCCLLAGTDLCTLSSDRSFRFVVRGRAHPKTELIVNAASSRARAAYHHLELTRRAAQPLFKPPMRPSGPDGLMSEPATSFLSLQACR